jgi:hypothetical protein
MPAQPTKNALFIQKPAENCKKPHTFHQKNYKMFRNLCKHHVPHKIEFVRITCSLRGRAKRSRPRRQVKKAHRRSQSYVENVFDRQRTNRPLQPPAVERGIWIHSIMQNKPKVKSPQIDLNPCITSTYAQMDNWLNAKNKPNQTQSNPTPKTAINPYITAAYTRKPPPRGPKNKPNSNPIQTQPRK